MSIRTVERHAENRADGISSRGGRGFCGWAEPHRPPELQTLGHALHADSVAMGGGVPLETRIALLRQHGSFSQAYSATFQPGLEHFGGERGFIAYKTVWGTAMVLADPVAARETAGDLIACFLRRFSDVAFWQVSSRVAEILAPLGFFINEMGTETRLDLASYDFGGQRKRNLRKAVVRAAKLGYVTRECPLAAVDLSEVKTVSAAWGGHTAAAPARDGLSLPACRLR